MCVLLCWTSDRLPPAHLRISHLQKDAWASGGLEALAVGYFLDSFLIAFPSHTSQFAIPQQDCFANGELEALGVGYFFQTDYVEPSLAHPTILHFPASFQKRSESCWARGVGSKHVQDSQEYTYLHRKQATNTPILAQRRKS